MRGRYVSHTWAHDPCSTRPRSTGGRARRRPRSGRDNRLQPHQPRRAGRRRLRCRGRDTLTQRSSPSCPAPAGETAASNRVDRIVEGRGLQAGARSLARAEAKADVGKNVGSDVAEVLTNIDAMELAVEETAAAAAITVDCLIDIHQALMRRAPNAAIADCHNGLGVQDVSTTRSGRHLLPKS
jgi:hypothetical protein